MRKNMASERLRWLPSTSSASSASSSNIHLNPQTRSPNQPPSDPIFRINKWLKNLILPHWFVIHGTSLTWDLSWGLGVICRCREHRSTGERLGWQWVTWPSKLWETLGHSFTRGFSFCSLGLQFKWGPNQILNTVGKTFRVDDYSRIFTIKRATSWYPRNSRTIHMWIRRRWRDWSKFCRPQEIAKGIPAKLLETRRFGRGVDYDIVEISPSAVGVWAGMGHIFNPRESQFWSSWQVF